jgi:hypothetical protein
LHFPDAIRMRMAPSRKRSRGRLCSADYSVSTGYAAPCSCARCSPHAVTTINPRHPRRSSPRFPLLQHPLLRLPPLSKPMHPLYRDRRRYNAGPCSKPSRQQQHPVLPKHPRAPPLPIPCCPRLFTRPSNTKRQESGRQADQAFPPRPTETHELEKPT